MITPTPSITLCNASQEGRYNGHELSQPAVRTGADNSLTLPSRIGNTLHYRKGQAPTAPADQPTTTTTTTTKARKGRNSRGKA